MCVLRLGILRCDDRVARTCRERPRNAAARSAMTRCAMFVLQFWTTSGIIKRRPPSRRLSGYVHLKLGSNATAVAMSSRPAGVVTVPAKE
jgi:hypothetical protein